MKISVLTLFPEFINSLRDYSIVGRAIKESIVLVIKNENFRYYIPNVKEFVKDIGDVIIADPIEGMREWKFLY